MAKTVTKTYTFTRIEAVKLQFKHTLLYASDKNRDYINLLLECVEKRYIESFTFLGLNKQNQCEIEFVLQIDWEKYQVSCQMENEVQLSPRTTNEGVSVIVEDWTDFYLDIIEERGLIKKIQWTYTNEVYNDNKLLYQVRKKLDSSVAAPTIYASSFKTKEVFVVRELSEMSGSVRL